jgi:hypothetical protein
MEAIGLLVTLEARAGKEADAKAFLKSAQPLALEPPRSEPPIPPTRSRPGVDR